MTLLTVFIVGTAASLSLCAVVRLPIVLAYVAGTANSKRHGVVLSVLFAVGLIVGTVLLGLTAGPQDEGLRTMLGLNKVLFWLLGAGLFITGVLLSGVINPHLLPAGWQKVARRMARTGATGALLLGCAFGLLQTPACPTCGSAMQALVQVAGEKSSLGGALLFSGFAAGQGLMMLAIGVLTSLLMPELLVRLRAKMCSIEQRIQLLAGNVLMILGIYFIIVG
jgi:cytochrome c biogenesis protein CcdA